MNGFHIKDVLAYNVKFCWLGVPMKSTKYYSTTNFSDCTVLTISDGKTWFVIFQDGEALDVRSRIVPQTVTIGVCVTQQDRGRSVPTARRGGWGRTVGPHVMDCRSQWTVESVCATVVVIMESLVRTLAIVSSLKTKRERNIGVITEI